MANLAYRLAESLLAEIDNAEVDFHIQGTQASEETSNPICFIPKNTTVIPVLLLLNQFNEADYELDGLHSKLETKLLRYFHTYGFQGSLRDLLSCRAHFIFIIDDLDEVTPHNMSANLRDVRRFVESLSAQLS